MIEFFDAALDGPGGTAEYACDVCNSAVASLGGFDRCEPTTIFLRKRVRKISHSLLSDRITLNQLHRHPWPRLRFGDCLTA
jgi:hypothetical protein